MPAPGEVFNKHLDVGREQRNVGVVVLASISSGSLDGPTTYHPPRTLETMKPRGTLRRRQRCPVGREPEERLLLPLFFSGSDDRRSVRIGVHHANGTAPQYSHSPAYLGRATLGKIVTPRTVC